MTITQTEVSFPTADGTVLPGVLTLPAADRPRPALLMIYEVFGLTDEMRRVARELAGEGWVVLIPDLFAPAARRARRRHLPGRRALVHDPHTRCPRRTHPARTVPW